MKRDIKMRENSDRNIEKIKDRTGKKGRKKQKRKTAKKYTILREKENLFGQFRRLVSENILAG